MRILGVDPGSECTGYGCIDTDGNGHRVVVCGVLTPPRSAGFPEKLLLIHRGLVKVLKQCCPEAVAIEDIFYSRNVRSALKLGHVRGVLILAASEAGIPVCEYSPTEIKSAVVGYGRAGKQQVQQMVTLLLCLDTVPSPLDVSDALATAICHSHSLGPTNDSSTNRRSKSWRRFRQGAKGIS